RDHGVRVQISHLPSMTMGRTAACIGEIERARTEGVDVSFDCYPYDAFCTKAGSPVFDGDLEARWNGRGPECLEAASGKFRGQRLTHETLSAMRAEDPLGLIVAHLMDEEEIMSCLLHPDCVVISDATFIGDGAHPRVSGSFPRALRALRAKGVAWEDALAKMTSRPAERYRIDAGTIRTGGRADLVVFDPATFEDRATFQNPFAPPEGLKAVVVGGKIALQDGRASDEPHGKIFRRTPR
ncbi:amidohydrolase family protein, partial [Synergistaceae bacterium OttesenSCG-928-I11]|nr:amidohydrolase family protein [Synergistaceae bacterium OttesenSCG-928-I11]